MSKRRRYSGKLVPVDIALFHPELIAPIILQPCDDYGDPEEAAEMATRNHEGRQRHGFRALLEELG